jgi:hypothetical protein
MIPMLRAKRWSSAAVFGAMQLAIGCGSVAAQPAASYASLQNLPDLAGAWTPLGPPFVLPPPGPGALPATSPCELPPAYKTEVAARCQQALDPRTGTAARDYCGRQYFTGRPPQRAGGAFEILYTPGRVTMAVESGLVRRIYLSDAPPANALDASRSGTSIGRWEGGALIVQTSRLDPAAPMVPGSSLGPGAEVVERIVLTDADTLAIEATLTAPAILATPLTTRMQYRRAPGRVFTDFDTCVDADRSVDQTTGLDRFDKTPPADLPPPPSE